MPLRGTRTTPTLPEWEGIEGLVVNCTISNVGEKLQPQNLTLAKLGIGGNTILGRFAGRAPFGTLGGELNSLEVGVVLGYTKSGTDWLDADGNVRFGHKRQNGKPHRGGAEQRQRHYGSHPNGLPWVT